MVFFYWGSFRVVQYDTFLLCLVFRVLPKPLNRFYIMTLFDKHKGNDDFFY